MDTASRARGRTSCPHCSAQFEYMLVHSGLTPCAYAYCDACGMTALLEPWSPRFPPGTKLTLHRSISPEIEPLLRRCECGGRFRADATPRCPACRQPLAAEAMAPVFEQDAPAGRNGWRWQRNWTGLYCLIVNHRWVDDNWV